MYCTYFFVRCACCMHTLVCTLYMHVFSHHLLSVLFECTCAAVSDTRIDEKAWMMQQITAMPVAASIRYLYPTILQVVSAVLVCNVHVLNTIPMLYCLLHHAYSYLSCVCVHACACAWSSRIKLTRAVLYLGRLAATMKPFSRRVPIF